MINTASIETVCMGCFTQLETSENVCPMCGYNEMEQTVLPHQLRPRTILNGKYLIGKVLGEGGFGITYIGWDLNLDLKVAVKEYYPTGFVTRETTVTSTVQPFTGSQGDFFLKGRERFIDEAKSLARFRSLPGIVAVNDFFMENGTVYIVMEYIEGQTLKEYLFQMGGKLPAVQVFDMMKSVMTSLAEVHKSGMIHRDISPDNIMISNEGCIKLLDFGAAKYFADSGNKSMSILLKPGFAPEEQYRSRGKQGPWTDVYALCATIYKCITGVTPEESLDRLQEDTLQPLDKTGIAVSHTQAVALMRGLAVFQKDRFQSVAELFSALYGSQEGAQTTAPVETVNSAGVKAPPPTKHSKKNKILATAIIGVCVVILAVFVTNLLWQPDTEIHGMAGDDISKSLIELMDNIDRTTWGAAYAAGDIVFDWDNALPSLNQSRANFDIAIMATRDKRPDDTLDTVENRVEDYFNNEYWPAIHSLEELYLAGDFTTYRDAAKDLKKASDDIISVLKKALYDWSGETWESGLGWSLSTSELENAEPDAVETFTGNPFFFNTDSDTSYSGLYYGYFVFEDNIEDGVGIEIEMMATSDIGALYKLVVDEVDGVPRERLNLGYFFVQNEQIYKLYFPADPPEMLVSEMMAGVLDHERIGEWLDNSALVCSESATDDTAAEDGWHQYVVADGDRRIYHLYNDSGGTTFYESFTWERGKGLVSYCSGYGAGRESIELTIQNTDVQSETDMALPELPWHLADIWYNFQNEIPDFQQFEFDVTVYRDVPSEYYLYISPVYTTINDQAFYAGIQTNIAGQRRAAYNEPIVWLNKGGIFSRWSRDKVEPIGFEYIDMPEGGLCQSDDYEGSFCGVRYPVEWTAGTYTLSFIKEETITHKNTAHTWVAFYIKRKGTTEEATKIGRLLFEGEELKLGGSFAAFVEIYGYECKVPTVTVEFSAPRINGNEAPIHSADATFSSNVVSVSQKNHSVMVAVDPQNLGKKKEVSETQHFVFG